MAPKRDAPAQTRVVEENRRVETPKGPDSNIAEAAPLVDVDPERRGPLTGRLIDGRYRILELIGEGGMGAVYRAIHTLMDKELAVKVLLPEYTAMPGLAKRFQQEAQSASRLDHPGIIQVFDFGETEDGLLYLVMAHLQGRSLTEVITKEAPLSTPRATALGRQICEALAHAHSQGVVHRDLKPDNVMLISKDGSPEQVKLLDFGIAKITQGEGAASGLTEVGAIFGTPEYLSPEQAAGDPVDHRTDLYSLGVILYEMLSGRKLFSADTNMKYLHAHMHTAPRPLTTLVPQVGLSPQLDQVVLRALAKNPNERFQSAVELINALTGATSQPAILVHPGVVGVGSGPLPPVPAPGTTVPHAITSPFGNPVPPVQYTIPPVTDPEAEEKRKLVVWGLGAAVGALLLLVVALSIVLSDEDGEGKPNVGKSGGSNAMAATAASDTNLQVVRGLIAASKLKEAEKRLNDIVQNAPKDPRVHLMFGHLHCRRGAVEACLAAYNTAVMLDGALREDGMLVANVQRLLVKRKGPRWGRPVRERTLAFVHRCFTKGKLGEPVVTMFTRYVNKWWEHDLVWQVIELLQKHEAASGIDWSHAYELRFRGEDSCELRKKYIQEIVARKDPKLLPLLGKVYSEPSLKKHFSKKRLSNDCLQEDAAEAIESLGGVLPKKKAPPRHRPATLTGQVQKLFKGLK